jgi:membrane associated rhomboid family serine protease
VFIPLSVDRPLSRPTLVNHVLIALNVLIHLGVAAMVLPGFATADGREIDPSFVEPLQGVVQRFGVSREAVFGASHELWRFISYAFLHAGSMHLLGNMLVLWVFGPSVEDRLGRVGYCIFYFAGAIAAGVAHVLSDTVPAIGASGAVAAVSGAFIVLFPRTHVKVFVMFFFIGVYEFPVLWFIGAAIAMDIYSGSFGSSDVAHAAHLGGYALGILLAAFLLLTKILPREPQYDLIAIFKHRQRRSELQRAVREAEAASKVRMPGAVMLDGATISLRADLSRAAEARDWPAAARACDALNASQIGLACVDRRVLKDLGGALFASGQDASAALAFAALIKHYPQDPEVPNVSVLLGVLLVRRLGRPAEAIAPLKSALPKLSDPDERALAADLLEQAVAAAPPASQ